MSESDIENDGHSLRRNNLLPEIITDVLSRLPVKSLCRFKCVSPSWNSLISSTHFSKTHFNRTYTCNPNKHLLHNIILQSPAQDLYAVDITADVPFATKLDLPSLQPPEDKRVNVLGSCDGLLLFCHIGTSNFFLVNPSTRECKKLPRLPFVLNRDHGFNKCLYGVGYDSSTDDHKVVMLSYYDTMIVTVYSLKTNAWRRIQDTQYIIHEGIQDTQYIIHDGITFGVYFNGCLHVFFWRDGSNLILAFDLADEVFREVPLPASWVDNEISPYELAVRGGCLCLVYIPSGSHQIEVWTMKEYGLRASWTKTMIEIMTEIDDMGLLVLPGLLAENEFLLTTKVQIVPGATEAKLVVYNHQTGTVRDIVAPAIPTKFSFLGTYVESLLPCLSYSPTHCNHVQGIGKQG